MTDRKKISRDALKLLFTSEPDIHETERVFAADWEGIHVNPRYRRVKGYEEIGDLTRECREGFTQAPTVDNQKEEPWGLVVTQWFAVTKNPDGSNEVVSGEIYQRFGPDDRIKETFSWFGDNLPSSEWID